MRIVSPPPILTTTTRDCTGAAVRDVLVAVRDVLAPWEMTGVNEGFPKDAFQDQGFCDSVKTTLDQQHHLNVVNWLV